MASPIECQVENCSSNSVAFEVVFSPGKENARKPRLTPRKAKESLNKEHLDEKMKAAEKRRTPFLASSRNAPPRDDAKNGCEGDYDWSKLESSKGELLAKAATKNEYINQVQLTKQQAAEEQSRMVKEKLKQKMCLHMEKKEAQIKALIDRLHAKDQHIKETQEKLKEIIKCHAKKVEEKIQQKEALTKENLELHRKAQLERWQAREKRIQEVLAALQESIEKHSKAVEMSLQQKMEMTAEKRQAQIRLLQERLQIKSQKIEQARQLVDALVQEQSKVFQEKLTQKLERSEEKRNAQLKAIQERLGAHDKHVVEVCQQAKTRRAEKAQG